MSNFGRCSWRIERYTENSNCILNTTSCAEADSRLERHDAIARATVLGSDAVTVCTSFMQVFCGSAAVVTAHTEQGPVRRRMQLGSAAL